MYPDGLMRWMDYPDCPGAVVGPRRSVGDVLLIVDVVFVNNDVVFRWCSCWCG